MPQQTIESAEVTVAKSQLGTIVRRLNEPFARAAGTSFAIQLAGVGLAFLQAVLAARVLGPAGYGTVAVAMSVVSIIATVCLLGFGALSVREISARRASADRAGLSTFVAVALAVVAVTSTVASGLFVWVVWQGGLIGAEYREVMLLCGMLIVPLSIIALLRGMAQGLGRIALAQIPGDIARPTIVIAVMAFAVFAGTGFGAVNFVWTAIVSTWFVTLFTGVRLWIDDFRGLPRPSRRRTVAPHVLAALPFLGLGLTGLLEGELSTLLLGSLAGPFETGIFQPLVRIAPLVMLPVHAALMQFAPQIAAHWQRGEIAEIRALTHRFTGLTTGLTVVCGVAIALAGPLLLRVFGDAFGQSAPLMWLIVVAQIVNAACGPVGWMLIMSNKSGWTLAGQIGGLAVNVAIGLVLIPSWGAAGAALGMAGGIVTWNIALVAVVRRRFGFDPTIVGVLLARREAA